MTTAEALPHVHRCPGDDCENYNDVPCFDSDLLPVERHEAAYELCGICLMLYLSEEPDDGHEEADR